ncbi:MAG: serine/threonine protein kinase [Planctomycetota bacterium]|jgi:tetratricopeptide (TPR) repeat protein/tRNA A-37 threonylcarbamoyl transferase component Bud32
MLTPERYQRVYEIFTDVCGLEGPARVGAIARHCADDAELRDAVEALLREDGGPDSFLDAEPADLWCAEIETAEAPLREDALLNHRIGKYHVRRVIDSGGMGTVYEAVQERPRRTVALKVIREGLTSPSAARRFEYEAQILARLRHPGIAQVFDAGTDTDPTTPGASMPYFAMEYIPDAVSITAHASKRALSTRDRLEMLADVCDAVHHGHQRGVIHRDLKPANILVDSAGCAKVIDFGVARATNADTTLATHRTDIGQLIGTLQYMSPEQCAGDPDDLDTRSDVYALGFVLYELLCAMLPYDVSTRSVPEAVRMIREDTPPRPSTHLRSLRGDVETIVLKAIEKDRQRRYQSAAELAADIRRYLNDEPIAARPPSAIYYVRKLARRHRPLAAGVAVAVFALVGGASATSWQAIRATRAEKDALRLASAERLQREEAERQAATVAAINDFLNNDLLASVSPSIALGREVTVREVFDAASRKIEGRFDDQHLVEASIRLTLGQMYLALGHASIALPHLRRSHEIREAQLGPSDEATLDSLNELGKALRQTARYDDAERAHERALAGRRELLGPSHRQTLFAERDLALVYVHQTRYDEATSALEHALDVAEREYPRDLELRLGLRSSLAHVLWETGELDAAARAHSEVYESYRAMRGEDHPDTLHALINLGATHMMNARHDLAQPVIERALRHAPRVLGEEHQLTMVARNNLLWSQLHQGRYAEVIEPYEQLLGPMVARNGDDHHATIVLRSNLGLAYVGVGRFEEALVQLERALDSSRRIMPEHWLEGAHLSRYGRALVGVGRVAEGEAAMIEARDMTADRLSPQDGRTLTAWRALASHFEATGQKERAVEELGAMLEVMLAHYGEEFRETLETMNEYGRLLWEIERIDDAMTWHRRAMEIRQRLHGEDDPGTRQSMYNLAVQYAEKERYDEAIELFERCLAISLRLDGEGAFFPAYTRATLARIYLTVGEPELALEMLELAAPAFETLEDSWELGYMEFYRGVALSRLKRLEEAEPRLTRAFELVAREFGAGHERVAMFVQALVDLYDAWDRPDDAEAWRARRPEP